MRKLLGLVLLALAAGCDAGNGNILIPIPIPIPIPLPLPSLGPPPLDGQWVLTDTTGNRACLVIQENRVSIVNLSYSPNGDGLVSRIIDEPVIVRTADSISLTVSFSAKSGDETVSRLTFTGFKQSDESYRGTRRDETTAATNGANSGPKSTASESPAILARQ